MVKELAEHFEAGKQLGALPVRDARREQVARRRATGSRASSSTCPSARRVPAQGARPAALRPPARARAGPRRGATSWRAIARPARARQRRRTGSAWSTRRTTTSASSCSDDRRRHRRRSRDNRRAGARFGGVDSIVLMASGPDLFVVCKSCGAEVSPYITECPYCGTRLRKRAPKLERGGVPKPPKRAAPRPSLPRLRPGEIPGIRGRPAPVRDDRCSCSRRSSSRSALHVGPARPRRPRCSARASTTSRGARSRRCSSTARPATRSSPLGAVFLFGWLLERRHGCVGAAARVLRRRRGRHASLAIAVDGDGRSRSAPTAPRSACSRAWAMRDVLGRRQRPRGRPRPARRAGDRRRAGPAAARRRGGRAASPASSAASIGLARSGLGARPPARALSTATTRSSRRARDEAADDPAVDLARALRRDGGEQAAGGHRVADQPAQRLGRRRGPGREGLGVGAVAARAAGERALVGEQLEHAVDRRDGGRVDLGRQRRSPRPARGRGRAARSR